MTQDLSILNTARNSLFKAVEENCSNEMNNVLSQSIIELELAIKNKNTANALRSISILNNELIKNNHESETFKYINTINHLFKLFVTNKNTIPTPNNIFFVWIGSIGDRSLEYVDFWCKSNPKEEISIWYDSHFFLAGKYKKTIYQIFNLKGKNYTDIIKTQDAIYKIISSKISENKSFDQAFIELVANIDKTIASNLEYELIKIKRRYFKLTNAYNLKDIADYPDVFYCTKLYEYYCTEVILRFNLAAASDILRMSLLYKYGGTYIDVDTLPSLEHIFKSTNNYCPKHIREKNLVDILKSESVLMRLREKNLLYKISDDRFIERKNKIIKSLESSVESLYPGIVSCIKKDIDSYPCEKFFLPREKNTFYRDSFYLSAAINSLNEFNNNIISASSGSRITRIIIKEILVRYKFIEKNKFTSISHKSQLPNGNHYLSRLSRYRLDTFDGGDNVTLFLTGPSLILEVILGLSYDILKLSNDISPIAISYALRTPVIGISYLSQTMYTLEHMDSSWM